MVGTSHANKCLTHEAAIPKENKSFLFSWGYSKGGKNSNSFNLLLPDL